MSVTCCPEGQHGVPGRIPRPEEEPPCRVCGQRAYELETHGTTWNATTITLLIWDPDPAVGGQNNDRFSLQEQGFRILLRWGHSGQWMGMKVLHVFPAGLLTPEASCFTAVTSHLSVPGAVP